MTTDLPSKIHRFDVRRRLGYGGMATVYLVDDPDVRQEIALKVLHEVLKNHPMMQALFREEMGALRLIDHANVVRVYEFHPDVDPPYLTMPYYSGGALQAEKVKDPSEAIDLVHTLALALGYVHRKGVAHHDLKPENILFTADRKPVIADFGLAVRFDREGALLRGMRGMVGTPAYMAPEQFHEKHPQCGSASPDVWALGVILYELLTGVPPFHGTDLNETRRRVFGEEPTPPSRVCPELHEGFDAICRLALAKDPASRYRTMEEFAQDLAEMIVVSSPVVSMPTRPPAVPASAVRYSFVGYHFNPPRSAHPQDRLYLDVGNDLRDGVIDHHQQLNASRSSTGLVLTYPQFVSNAVKLDRKVTAPFWIYTHRWPDLDSVAAAFLTQEYLEKGALPAVGDRLAHYIDRVDQGHPGFDHRRPHTLYTAYQRLVDRAITHPVNAPVERWRRLMTEGVKLVAHIAEVMARNDCSVFDVDPFAYSDLFDSKDRTWIDEDQQRYRAKLVDPDCQTRQATLRLPSRYGGRELVKALLTRDVQNEDDPQRVRLFKDWARAEGFIALSVGMTENGGQSRSVIISVTPGSELWLPGLGDILEKQEAEERTRSDGQDTRNFDPSDGSVKRARPGFTSVDPWYDGRSHGYTIIDAPTVGTVLTFDAIEEVFLDYGEGQASVSPYGEVEEQDEKV